MVDNLEIDNINEIFNDQSETTALEFEFKLSLNAYLKDLVASPVRSLADVIAFNKKHSKLVSIFEKATFVYLFLVCQLGSVWYEVKNSNNFDT